MQKKILVVDDEPANIFTLRSMLEPQEGYVVDSTESGLEALEMIKVNDYDLVLLDVMMPQIDGYEVCSRMKVAEPDLPVILVTALVDSEYLRKGFEVGAIDYIRKPVDELELLSRVNNILKNKESEAKIKELYSSLLRDLEVASRIQMHMLPPHFVIDNDINYSTGYSPSSQIGGDIFDIIKLSNDKYFVYIGDISGHGAQAALLMSAIKSTIHLTIEEKKDTITPAQFMNILNRTVCDQLFENNYMTLLAGFIDLKKGVFRYFNAGHPPIIEYDIENCIARKCNSNGSIPVGWRGSIEYLEEEEDVMDIKGNHIYMMFTDGIIECNDESGEEFGLDGLISLLENAILPQSSLALPQKIKEWLTRAGFETSTDDFSMLVFESMATGSNRFAFEVHKMPGVSQNKKVSKYAEKIYTLDTVALAGRISERLTIEKLWDNELAAKVELTVNEFLTNIIVHGLPGMYRPIVVMELIFTDNEAMICFYDNGIEWEPKSGGDIENIFEDIDGFAESGRGIAIINSISRSLRRMRHDDINETIITLTK
ncbi:MAG: response regulator [Sedimentisphaeraceae bacterium JB056]